MTSDFWSPIKLSLEIATVSSIIVLITGILLARGMAHTKFKGKAIIETIFLLPLVLPPTVVGFLLIIIFGRNSVIGQGIEWFFGQPIMFTWWAAAIASIIVSFPLMYNSAKVGFESIDVDIENAARVDGAGKWKLFLFVSTPLAMKSIISGGILSFARGLGEFGATLMFAGNIPGKTQTTSVAIYLAIDTGNMQLAWSWVACMIGISFIMLFLVHFIKS
ncbi:molybdate ABC transporter permease subunit [Bacillus sp. JJ1521]|uniref:molybdate ABC transporter permease subunit n=1 Tax=Bacillus sp. JJ1521 TaxID=3122957 RepID=UPI002FFDCE26